MNDIDAQPAAIQSAMADPAGALEALRMLDAQDNLLDFIKQGWPTIEPGTAFVSGWAVQAICEHLEAVTRGEIKRLLINVPPGCTKSMTVNVFWPAWEWGPRNLPHYRYISAANGQDLSTRDMVRCRDLVNGEWYQERWGDQFDWKGDQNAKTLYENTKTGFRIASSVGSNLTGKRGQRIIVDDPHSVQSIESDVIRYDALRWFAETLPTRLNNLDTDAIVVIMQRVHQQDISSLALEMGYEHLCLPMEYEADHPHKTKTSLHFVDPRTEDGDLLWPERFSGEAIERQKKEFRAWGGTYAEAGQLQQRPAPRGGGMFNSEWWEYVDELPDDIIARVRGWDLAATDSKEKGGNKAAYTAGVYLAADSSDNIYIVNSARGKLSPKGVDDLIKATATKDGLYTRQAFPQDPGQAGKAQKRAIARLLKGHEFKFGLESGSKEVRATPLASQCEAGNVFIVRGKWNNAFTTEAEVFPAGTYKDQIDAASRAFSELLLLIAAANDDVGGAPEAIELEE